MVLYQLKAAPGAVQAPEIWPVNRLVHLHPDKFTLVMALHPHCPCSRASVHELATVVARSDDRLAVSVLMNAPPGAPVDWTLSDLRIEAAAIPGVTVLNDTDGSVSRDLAATTSGQVAVYDPKGHLRFSGGITDGRGHEGDNAGVDAILALCRGQGSAIASTPVYGCPLCGKAEACTQPATQEAIGKGK